MSASDEPALEKALAAMLQTVTGPVSGMDVGIGVDVEHHSRWRNGGLRVNVLFTPAELARCQTMADIPAQLAGTWCAKEATVKAMASHVRLSLRDVEVVHDPFGRPGVRLQQRGLQQFGHRVRISISRTADVSVAVALFLPPVGPADS